MEELSALMGINLPGHGSLLSGEDGLGRAASGPTNTACEAQALPLARPQQPGDDAQASGGGVAPPAAPMRSPFET